MENTITYLPENPAPVLSPNLSPVGESKCPDLAWKIRTTIATIDCETLSLHRDAVVYEIGIIITDVLPVNGVSWTPKDLQELEAVGELKYTTIYPSVLAQVLLGRRIDITTVAFHEEYRRKNGLSRFKHHLAELEAVELNVAQVELRRFLNECWDTKVAEVWFNHPEFDVPRIEGALEDGNQNYTVPWNYRSVCDVSTEVKRYRRTLRPVLDQDATKLIKTDPKIAHTGIGDCIYNLQVIAATGFYGECRK